MKRFNFLILLAFSFCLVSCFDTVEEIEINDNGTGTYKMNMDLSKGFEMMKGFINDSDLQKGGVDGPIDTTFQLDNMLDTAKNVTDRKKELFKDGTIHINMDLDKSIFKVDMRYPYKNFFDLNELYASIQKGDGSLSEALKMMTQSGDAQMPQGDDSTNNMNQINALYDVVFSNGSYSKTLNKDRYDAFVKGEKTEELKGMMSMMGDLNYTVILKLPKAAKTVSNKLAVVSPDKKTVTLKSGLFDVFDNPQLLEMKVTY